MKTLTTLLLLLVCGSIYADYPFEKYPAIRYRAYGQGLHLAYDSTGVTFKYTDPHSKAAIRIFFNFSRDADSSNILVYRNGQLVQRIIEPDEFNVYEAPDTVFVGDLNADGLPDLKVTVGYVGCGIASELVRKIYLLQRPDGTYSKYSITDFSTMHERDFSGDHHYEIIGMDLDHYANHSYWVFDIYGWEGNRLVNEGKRYNYPILIQYLFTENYRITRLIPREKMAGFSRPLPRWLDVRN